MPDRIIRAELLMSDAWLALKDNCDRMCWLALFLTADTLGNQPAGPYRLVHLWRAYGIDTTEKAAQTVSHLADVDLIRPYQVEGKSYIHIPRFNQSRRFLGRLYNVPPWATDQEKQAFEKKSRVIPKSSPVNPGEPPHGVGVGVGVGVKTKSTSTPPPVDNSSDGLTWRQFWEAKGKALGIDANPGESGSDYCHRVMEQVRGKAQAG